LLWWLQCFESLIFVPNQQQYRSCRPMVNAHTNIWATQLEFALSSYGGWPIQVFGIWPPLTSIDLRWPLILTKTVGSIGTHFRVAWSLTSVCDLWPHEPVNEPMLHTGPTYDPGLVTIWLLNSYVTFDLINIWRYSCCTYDSRWVSIGPELLKWDTFSGCLTFDFSMWHLTSWICEGTHVAHMAQVWLQLDLNCQNETHFRVTWLLTSVCDLWPHEHVKEPMLHIWPKFGCPQLDLNCQNETHLQVTWPLTSVCDLMNIWRNICCTCDPSLVAIGPELSKWDTFSGYFTFELILTSDSLTYEGTHVAPTIQVWL